MGGPKTRAGNSIMTRRFDSPHARIWSTAIGLLLTAGLVSGCALLDIGQDFTPEPAAQGLSSSEQRPLSTVQSEPSRTPAVEEGTPIPDDAADQDELPSHPARYRHPRR